MQNSEQRPRRQGLTRWRELATYANLGATIAVAVVGCGAVGWWLDHLLKSSPLGLLTGLLIGCAVALWEVWKVVRNLNNTEDSNP